jgi:hypothetical protein
MTRKTAATADQGPTGSPALRAASLRFGITPESGGPTYSGTGVVIGEVLGPLKTTVTLLQDGELRVCIVATDIGLQGLNVSDLFRRELAAALDIPIANVLTLWSHNHSATIIASNEVPIYRTCIDEVPEADLLPVGKELLDTLLSHAKRLPDLLEPVTVWWAEGEEGRITYNRKGRRADGSTYFMREEDRVLLGKDFNGDIDRQAPVVVLKNMDGRPVSVLVQFTGHPVTCYHPERPVVFGEWPQVACDRLAQHLSPAAPPPVSFLQGCAGDVNSKEMFRGGVERSRQFGGMLAASYIAALDKLRASRRDGLDYAVENIRVPLAPLPSRKVLQRELDEMTDFMRRAAAGDENTLECLGMNLPRDLSPAYRSVMIELAKRWNDWALGLHEAGRAGEVPSGLDMAVPVLRLGDVGIVAMPCEPFQGIGRQIRHGSPLDLTIPCGYANAGYPYITDAPNTGDSEYMSACYRYTEFLPPLNRPAGDVLARGAVKCLKRFAREKRRER